MGLKDKIKQVLRESDSDYKIEYGEISIMSNISKNIEINTYIKNNMFDKNGEYFYEDDNGQLKSLNIEFEGSDVIIIDNVKYRLSKNAISKGGMYFDIRYPNEINTLSMHSPNNPVPFGYERWNTNNEGKRWKDGNDAFFTANKI